MTGRGLLDLGAGTGKLTAALPARPGAAVTAVEPDLAMLGELRARFPAADARAGSAESIPLPDGRVDAVLVGQAWHWFDPDRALPEIARVLRPGGVLAALWNHDDENVDWVTGCNAAAVRNRTIAGVPGWGVVPAFPAHHAFSTGERASFPNPVPTSVDGLVSTLATHSWALVSDPSDRDAAFARVSPASAPTWRRARRRPRVSSCCRSSPRCSGCCAGRSAVARAASGRARAR